MTWTPLTEISGDHRPAWQRRCEAGKVPSYLDHEGRRLVWTGCAPPPGWAVGLSATLEGLSAQVQQLREEINDGRVDVAALRTELLNMQWANTPHVPQESSCRPAGAVRTDSREARSSLDGLSPDAREALEQLLYLQDLFGNQGALSKKLGITQPTVSKWLTGRRVPSPKSRALIAGLLSEVERERRRDEAA